MEMLVHFSLHLDSLGRCLLVRVNHCDVLVNHLFYYRSINWYIRVENYIDQNTRNGLPTKWTDLVTMILPLQHIKYHIHVCVCVMCMAVLALNGIWYPFWCMLREFSLLYLLLFWILLKLSMWNRLIKFFDGVFNHFSKLARERWMRCKEKRTKKNFA